MNCTEHSATALTAARSLGRTFVQGCRALAFPDSNTASSINHRSASAGRPRVHAILILHGVGSRRSQAHGLLPFLPLLSASCKGLDFY
jgi:hypothetical protein